MVNLNWFQPFDHVQYSVGVIYAVVLNLPRQERFEIEGVLLIGIIPDIGKEPPNSIFALINVDPVCVSTQASRCLFTDIYWPSETRYHIFDDRR